MKRLLFALVAFAAIGACTTAKESIAIERDGVGEIRFGRQISELPAQEKGIYDQILREEVEDCEMGDYTLYTFVLDGQPLAKVEDYEQNGVIANLEIVSPAVQLDGIAVGTTARELLRRGDVEQQVDDQGFFFFVVDGFLLRIDGFSEAGDAKLQQAYLDGTSVALTAEDFTAENVVCGIICPQQDAAQGAQGVAAPAAKKGFDWGELILGLVLIVIYIAMFLHMNAVRSSGADEPRIFTGSKWRMILFEGIMLLGLTEGFTVSRLVGAFVVAPIILYVYYLACMAPLSRAIRIASRRNSFHFIGGIWGNIERRACNEALISHLQEQKKQAADRLNCEKGLSEAEINRLNETIQSADHVIFEEKTGAGQTFAAILVSAFVALIFVFLTPFSAIGSYLKNYLIPSRKK